MMKKEIAVFIADNYADYEISFICPELHNLKEKFDIKIIAPTSTLVVSMGGLKTIPDYSIDEYLDKNTIDFKIDMLLLCGGTIWSEKKYNLLRFDKMSLTYESEQEEITQRYKNLKSKVEAEEKKTKSTNQFLETIQKYEKVTELNRSMLCELIDSIHVYQAEGMGKNRQQRVEINYRFLAGSQCNIT